MGDSFPCNLLVQSKYIILHWLLIQKTSTWSTLRLVSKQSRWSKKLCLYFVLRILNAHTTPVRIYGEPYSHKFCTVDNFWNITGRQATSPVATFQHVLGRGFMIPRVILIFIKCLSANQNQLFHMKVWYKYICLWFQVCLYLLTTATMEFKSTYPRQPWRKFPSFSEEVKKNNSSTMQKKK